MKKQTILIVDDEYVNRELLKQILQSEYNLIEACNGNQAIDMYKEYEDDLSLVLLDMVMPDKSGIQVIENINKNKKVDVPIIFVTALNNADIEASGIEEGAADYILKPFNAKTIKARIAAHIALKQNTDYLRHEIETGVKERTKIIESVIVGLADVVEYRHAESGEHIKRVQQITKMLITTLLDTTKLLNNYSHEELSYIVYGAILHDIGKIGILDSILLKNGKFNEEEYEIMKTHSEIGAQIAQHFYMGKNKIFVEVCTDICLHHHERWDGTGYPGRLKEQEIPIPARIVSVADAFDAIVSKRVYKEALTQEEAFEILKKDSGTCFDPQVVAAMFSLKKELENIYK